MPGVSSTNLTVIHHACHEGMSEREQQLVRLWFTGLKETTLRQKPFKEKPGAAWAFPSLADLGETVTQQAARHGDLDYLLVAREHPAMVSISGVALEKRLKKGTEADEDFIHWLQKDALLFFVTDTYGLKVASDYGLQQVFPWDQQSQLDAAEPIKLFLETNAMKGFGQSTFSLRKRLALCATVKDEKGVCLPVLILGKSGSGKELVARALWQVASFEEDESAASGFRGCESLACGMLSETLAIDQINGHWAGAFHGALNDEAGPLERCHRGSVFFDDIDSAPDPVRIQSVLLRFLGNPKRTVRRLGFPKNKNEELDRPAYTWLLFATNQNPRRLVRKKLMREDFLFRFQRILTLKPLCQRREDIPQIALALWKQRNLEGQFKRPLDVPALKWLRDRESEWAGNARELQTLLMCAQDLIAENSELTWVRAFEHVIQRGDNYLDWFDDAEFLGPRKSPATETPVPNSPRELLNQLGTGARSRNLWKQLTDKQHTALVYDALQLLLNERGRQLLQRLQQHFDTPGTKGSPAINHYKALLFLALQPQHEGAIRDLKEIMNLNSDAPARGVGKFLKAFSNGDVDFLVEGKRIVHRLNVGLLKDSTLNER